MKLTEELKSQIDNYFNQISAEQLYDILTYEYHMPDVGDIFDQGEYCSFPLLDFNVDIQNYSDIYVDNRGVSISEEASRVYLEAA